MQIISRHFKTIDSTSAWAKRSHNEFDHQSLTVISADTQTAGYGRLARRWVSPNGQNIYATFSFFVPVGFAHLANVAQVISLVIAQDLNSLPVGIRLKWPNDLMINGRKLGGILVETATDSTEICVMAGVGLNVNMHAADIDAIDQPATSLALECRQVFDLDRVREIVTTAVHRALSSFIAQGFQPFIDDYRNLLIHKKGDLLLGGHFEGIDDSGALRLKMPDGSIRVVY